MIVKRGIVPPFFFYSSYHAAHMAHWPVKKSRAVLTGLWKLCARMVRRIVSVTPAPHRASGMAHEPCLPFCLLLCLFVCLTERHCERQSERHILDWFYVVSSVF